MSDDFSFFRLELAAFRRTVQFGERRWRSQGSLFDCCPIYVRLLSPADRQQIQQVGTARLWKNTGKLYGGASNNHGLRRLVSDSCKL